MADWITIFREQLDEGLQEMATDVYNSCGEAVPEEGCVPNRESMSELSVSISSESHPVTSASRGTLHCEVSQTSFA